MGLPFVAARDRAEGAVAFVHEHMVVRGGFPGTEFQAACLTARKRGNSCGKRGKRKNAGRSRARRFALTRGLPVSVEETGSSPNATLFERALGCARALTARLLAESNLFQGRFRDSSRRKSECSAEVQRLVRCAKGTLFELLALARLLNRSAKVRARGKPTRWLTALESARAPIDQFFRLRRGLHS